jgi:hypothetical protein
VSTRTGGKSMLRISDNCFGQPFYWLNWNDYDAAPAYYAPGLAPVIRPLQLGPDPAAYCQILPTPASGLVTGESGQVASFGVKLSTQPAYSTPVTVLVQTNDPGEGLIRLSNGQLVPSRTLTFTSTTYNILQTVEVAGVDDALVDGPQALTCGLSVTSGPPCYVGKTAVVSAINYDNDSAGAPPQLGWVLPPSLPGPGARRLHALAYDNARSEAILFGGRDAFNTVYADTWRYSGSQWSQISVGGPSPRWSSAMAFDAARQVIVLFGGHVTGVGSSLSDTWEWNGTSWTQRFPGGTVPQGRGEHAMAYDPVSQRVILYGGRTSGGTGTVLSDTWTWNGASNTWVQLNPSSPPGQRRGHGMVTDFFSDQIVLFGGSFTAAQDGRTYEWDGASWSLASSTGPSEREQMGIAYNALRGTVILHGGFFGAAMFNDTWEWNGAIWVQVPTPIGPGGPGPQRAMHRMVFDPVSNQVMFFGGINASNVDQSQTWLLPDIQSSRYYAISGVGTGAAFSLGFLQPGWSLSTPVLSLAPGSSPVQIAAALAQSLSTIAQTQGGLYGAQPVPGSPSVIQVGSMSALPPTLFAGPAGGPGTAVSYGGGGVAFNPTIHEIFLSGEDCNGNGQDDAIDLVQDPSIDGNGNGLIDSCEDHFSCAGSCGGQALSGCWCDEYCAFFGDCCADIGPVCASGDELVVPGPGPWDSCAGTCGGVARSGCGCDPDCVLRGDCCDDFCAMCTAEPCPPPCPSDTNGDGWVDVIDLVNVVLDWGTGGAEHHGDVDGSGFVDVADLVNVVLLWGPCGGGGDQ